MNQTLAESSGFLVTMGWIVFIVYLIVAGLSALCMRAAVRAVLGEHASPGTDYVLIGRRGTLERPYGALCDDLRVALKRVGTSRSRRAGTKEMKQGQS